MKPKDNLIILKGIKVNNLKDVDVTIPRNRLVVVTGVSGSGKSSLVFDTIYAEGQRRYVESLSSYARQFLDKIQKPNIAYVEGIPPSIAIEQRSGSSNPRSTVGTSTEIYEYMKLLFARLGKTYSPISGKLVKRNTVTDVVDFIFTLPQKQKFMILAPLEKGKKNTRKQTLETLLQNGFSRIFINKKIFDIEDVLLKDIDDIENLYLLVDRCVVKDNFENRSRITDSIETAYFQGEKKCLVVALFDDGSEEVFRFSNTFEADGITFRKPSVNMFTFTNSYGACPHCNGSGTEEGIDRDLVIPDKRLSINDGAIACWNSEVMGIYKKELIKNARQSSLPIFKPISKMTEEQVELLWKGNDYFVGLNDFFAFLGKNAYKIQNRVLLSRYRGKTTCPHCKGGRLAKDAFYVKIKDKHIGELVEMSLDELLTWFKSLVFKTAAEKKIAEILLNEIITRLTFLCDLGLSYLSLNRLSATLSGGELQRVNLATSLGSNLVGSLYVLDEPSIGLHSIDTKKLIKLLKHLRDICNTVIVVEHDEEMMRAADYIIDVGPYSGKRGGNIVFEGKPTQLLKCKNSLTAKYLTHELNIPIPKRRRHSSNKIQINQANLNNLKYIDVQIPLNVLTVITGVSGSGKSSLVKGVLYPQLLHLVESERLNYQSNSVILSGDTKLIKGVELVDQNPIGRSTRSNAATYIGVFDYIRQLFAEQPLSKSRGYKPGFFSFNIAGGRCESCYGEGKIKIKMQFMSDVEILCDECKGKGYKEEALEVKFENMSIADILQLTVDEAIDFFYQVDAAKNKGVATIIELLKPLQDVGLGYLQLGQNASSLSGGEAQRVKLAYFLAKSVDCHKRMFLFDEPTTGLHFHDIQKLYNTFNLLIEKGHTVLVIEHNLEIVKCADWVIELGPGGGKNGGNIVFSGTPEEMLLSKKSKTAPFLKEKLLDREKPKS